MVIYIYIALLLIGTLLTYSAYKQYNQTQAMMYTGGKTKATVIDFITITNRDGSYAFKPIFEYLDKRKNKIVFESDIASYPKAYKIGEKVTIIHTRDNTEQKIVSFWGLYRGTIILLVLASPMLIIGGGYMLYNYW